MWWCADELISEALQDLDFFSPAFTRGRAESAEQNSYLCG